MSIDVPTLIGELRANLGGLDSTDLSDNDALLLLNREYWALIDRFKFREKEVTASFPTVSHIRLYQVPSPFEALRQLSIEDINTFAHTTLERMTEYDYENNYVNDSVNEAKPTHYVRTGAGIYLWPTPDLAYTIVFKYWTTLNDLDSVNNTTPAMPQVWHEIILLGGTWRGFIRFGDYARSAAAKSSSHDLINDYINNLVAAKEETDTHRGGLDVIGYDDVYQNAIIARDISRQNNLWPWNG